MLSELKPIHVYSRKQALTDGSLVGLQPRFARQLDKYGFVVPVDMTAAAFGTFVEGPNSGNISRILFALRRAARNAGDRQEIKFSFDCLDEDAGWITGELKSVIGPDDDANPCITLMLPDED